MGYVVEIRAGDLDAFQTDLYRGTSSVDAPAALHESVRAAMVGSDAVTATPEMAHFLVDAVRNHSWWWETLQHSSSGGESFRTSVAAEAAPTFGPVLVDHLLGRPVYNRIYTYDHPIVGWVSAEEVGAAAANARRADTVAGEVLNETVQRLLPVVERAAERNLAIFGLYI